MWRVWQMKIQKSCQWGKCLILEKALHTNAVDVEERKPQKQQGNNIKDWFTHTKRKGNSELTSISLLIIHHNRMKYADGVSSMKLEKRAQISKSDEPKCSEMSGYSLEYSYLPFKVLITLCNSYSPHIIAEESEIQANKVIPSNTQKIRVTNWVATSFFTPAIKVTFLVECFSQKETDFYLKAYYQSNKSTIR